MNRKPSCVSWRSWAIWATMRTLSTFWEPVHMEVTIGHSTTQLPNGSHSSLPNFFLKSSLIQDWQMTAIQRESWFGWLGNHCAKKKANHVWSGRSMPQHQCGANSWIVITAELRKRWENSNINSINLFEVGQSSKTCATWFYWLYSLFFRGKLNVTCQ